MPTKKPCARGLGSGLGGKTAAKCKMAKPKVAAKAELGDDDTLAVSVGADVEGEVDEFKEGSITELDGEGEAKEARKVKKKRLYRRKLCCCTLQQKRMHRNVKFAQFFMFCSLGCSIFAAFRPDWTVLSTRRENFQFPVDPDAVPCHGRPTCARCLDGTTEPKLPLPNPDVVSIPGGSPVTDPEQWLPAQMGCGWCEAQQKCMGGMVEHPLRQINLAACPPDTPDWACSNGGVPVNLEATMTPNFCGPLAVFNSSKQANASGTAQHLNPIWTFDSVDDSVRTELKPVDRENYDYGLIDQERKYVPPKVIPRFPGWMQAVLECTGTVKLKIGQFFSCQTYGGLDFCADSRKVGGPCYTRAFVQKDALDCSEVDTMPETYEEFEKQECKKRAEDGEAFFKRTGYQAKDLDLCALKVGKEVESCNTAMDSYCFGMGQIAMYEQVRIW